MNLWNILSYNGQTKLADLEYAKRRGDLTSHEMRTASGYPITLSGISLIASQQGTVHFMSIEVAAQAFLFFPPVKTSLAGSRRSHRGQEQGFDPEVSFSHNHLNDLESLWWVAAWVVFHNYFLEKNLPLDHSPPTLQDTEAELNLAQILFPHSLASLTRRNNFQGPRMFLNTCAKLSSNKKVFCNDLNFLRLFLIEHYQAIEAKHPESVDPDSSDYSIYEEFTQAFSDLKASYQGWELDRIGRIAKSC